MQNLTKAEKIELILNFMTFTQGYWKEDVQNSSEAQKFITKENTIFSDEYDGLIILNKLGGQQIHEFIKKISEELIEHVQNTSLEPSVESIYQWFREQYLLPDIETSEEIAYYICGNLYHYGYKVTPVCNKRNGRRYRFEKIDTCPKKN